VVLGVSGGIAAYKSVLVARDLARHGAHVDVILSRAAREFVGVPTFEAVTHRPVRTSLWERDGALDHITLAHAADVVIVAPATANLLARAVAGIADDLLTTTLMATTAPVVVAPAMNDVMFDHPATKANVGALRERGWTVVGPDVGDLAEGPSDRPGRMAEPADIVAHAARRLSQRAPWSAMRVLVTAGPTREAIDPVRLITNRSSGKMGYRLAAAAWQRGADVVLVSGPSAESPPIGVEVVQVESTADMRDAVAAQLPRCDVFIMAAAPADYRPAAAGAGKLARAAGALALDLVPTDDILLATVSRRATTTTIVGFALETGDAVAKGRAKLDRKQLDMIVVNDVHEPGAGPEGDTNAVTILDRRGGSERVSLRSKADVADAVLDAVDRWRD
jgi:phosphopantothenoylcysteine decarboxylase/phosphopantothenate--cysteine ligase